MKKKIVTHNGRFHADDLFAVATLDLIFSSQGDEIEVTRTRDKGLIENADVVVDVGDIYDPEKNRFDHHQKLSSSGQRENGIAYAAFGLVWKHFADQLCSSDEVAKIVEQKLVIPMDASDNGVSLFELNDYKVFPYIIQTYLYSFMPLTGEDKTYDEAFMEALPVAQHILKREIKRAEILIKMQKKVDEIYQNTEDKRVIEFPEDFEYEDDDILWALSKYSEPQFIIVKTKSDDNWKAKALRKDFSGFESRTSLPKEWGGLREDELRKITGIPDAVFCHRALFMCVAKTRESISKMVEIALNKG